MLLVTGGWDKVKYSSYQGSGFQGSGMLDSTETFDPLLGSWTASGAKLPKPMQNHKVANINGRVLIFGN